MAANVCFAESIYFQVSVFDSSFYYFVHLVGGDLFARGGRGGKVRAYNFVGVVYVCLYVFDPADDCSDWAVDCVERFLVHCLAACFSSFWFKILSVIAVQCVYR